MVDKIRIIALGGLDELYKNLTIIEINEEIYVIECGVRFADRSNPGVDYIIPRYDYLVANKHKVRAYILTHGSDSMIGALPYIYEKVPAPIYCSAPTSIYLKGFCVHNHLDFNKYNVIIVQPSQDLVIAGRKISLFSTATNTAESFGLAISTSQGNIIYISDAVIHNDPDKGFTNDFKKMSRIAEDKTLVLLMDATNAEKSGYCSPKYRLIPIIKNELLNLPGRVFLAIDAPDLFNIIDTLTTGIKHGRKIIPYDESSKEIIELLAKTGYLNVQRDTICSIEDVNRLRPQDIIVFMTGFGNKLNSKISLLASRNNDEKYVFLKPEDTFIFANHITPENETSSTEALDELYHNDCKIIRVNCKQFIHMHACEEDIKSLLSIFRPRYFIPVSGLFKQLLASAKIALDMNIGLNHNTVFIVDNGNIVEFEAGFGKVLPTKVITGDLMIDGKGIGDIQSDVLEERQRAADDGVIVLGATISKSKHALVAGPDVQIRGLVFIKDNEHVYKEITRVFTMTIENELTKENYSITYMEECIKDLVFKSIRRNMNKSPIIIPMVCEIE